MHLVPRFNEKNDIDTSATTSKALDGEEISEPLSEEAVVENRDVRVSKTRHTIPKRRLNDDHLRELRAIWDKVPEHGRTHIPSIASRKDWAEEHGLENHLAVSAWFSRAKKRAKTVSSSAEEEIVEISKDEAMAEWRLVKDEAEGGGWAMKKVPVFVRNYKRIVKH